MTDHPCVVNVSMREFLVTPGSVQRSMGLTNPNEHRSALLGYNIGFEVCDAAWQGSG